jgi:pimeloyl-ACP methyl ester carboxylesterase
MTTKRSLLIRVLLSITIIFISLFSVVFSTIAFFIVARYTRRMFVIIATAAVVLVVSAAEMMWIVAVGFKLENPTRFVGIFSAGTWLLIAVLAYLSIFRPQVTPFTTIEASADTRYWNLSTGSHIAYTCFPGLGTPHAVPIIYLHGGPGIPTRASNFDFFSQLSHAGFDVYLYDQVGSGLSDHLDDIGEYTVARHVADLEAIRQQIGAAQVLLAGTSWGSVLAAHYMAAFPDHVARTIFISPGVLGDRRKVRYDYKRTAASEDDSILLPPLRFIVAGVLARINPSAAQTFASQREMGSLYDIFITGPGIEYQVNCKGYRPDLKQSARSGGANYYVNIRTLQSLKNTPDPRPSLRTNLTPALIMRGECDYIPWEATYSYKETLPNASLVIIPQAGHAITSPQPELVLSIMLAFLTGQPLPIEPYASSEPPT